MSDRRDPYAAFRLNLEQQQKRAKELLKAAQAGEAAAIARLQRAGFGAEFKLAHAQHAISKELRFGNWAALKQHCEALALARSAPGAVLDADCRTQHIRCGEDFLDELRAAGFHGDFNLHINPYHEGPVTTKPNWLVQRAYYLASTLGPYLGLTRERALADLEREEARLADARRYERVALWLEHDRYDQFVLLRCLAYFAEHGAPPRLELVTANDFPGATRFDGIGQLPAEALRLLWNRRRQVSAQQLEFARHAWELFRAPDPRPLAALARNGTPLLPDLAPALVRHLQELPALDNSLGLTQRLLLQLSADEGKRTVGRIVGTAMRLDPLPGLGDLGYELVLRDLERTSEPLVLRSGAHPPPQWHLDEVEITDAGRAVLAGTRNVFALSPPPRWVGGRWVTPGRYNWCWDDAARDVVSSRIWGVRLPPAEGNGLRFVKKE